MRNQKNNEIIEPGRNEYRDKDGKIIKQNRLDQSTEITNKDKNRRKANSRDRLENAEPYINDDSDPVTQKTARNNNV